MDVKLLTLDIIRALTLHFIHYWLFKNCPCIDVCQ